MSELARDRADGRAPDAPPPPGGPLYWTGVVLGWGLVVVGIVGGVMNVTSVPHWFAWLAGGLLAHDLVVAPAVAGIGRLLGRTVGGWARAYVQGAVAFSALVVAVALPAALAFGRDPGNVSVLPVNAWGGALVVLLEAGLVWAFVRSVRGLRRSLGTD